MSHRLSNSSDVTLASTDAIRVKATAQPFCKFHQFGYCKFGETCRNFHTRNTCSDPIKCNKTSCSARHPRPCKYYVQFGHCKFGSDCSFHHTDDVSDNDDIKKDMIKLKEDLNSVLLSLKVKENEIKELADRIKELESKPHIQNVRICNVCGYEARSVNSLKTHMDREHEIEKLRHVDQGDSLLLTPPSQLREKDTSSSPLSPSSSHPFLSPMPEQAPAILAHSTTSAPVPPPPPPLESSPSHTKEGKCTFPGCSKTSTNFFKRTKLDVSNVNYRGTKQISLHSNVFVCDLHLKFVPLQEMRKNPPVTL